MARSRKFDVLIFGSGFGGTLTAAMLCRRGLSVAVVDSGRHPRFAIGESTTPLADDALAVIADEYGLPELKPLTRYGSWKQHHPQLTCGLKRGFTYADATDLQRPLSERLLLVAASSADDVSDTHWLRQDTDEFFCGVARTAGAVVLEGARFRLERSTAGWTAEGTAADTGKEEQPFCLTAPFVIDAAGGNSPVLNCVGVTDISSELQTTSRSVFAHFSGVRPLPEVLQEQGYSCEHHPFSCDAAAVHHLLPDGWMWQLRFDDGTTSCGIMQSCESDAPAIRNPAEFRRRVCCSSLVLQEQFRSAEVVRPSGGYVATPRIQRLRSAAAGEDWAALPSAVGFVDPLHSTGIAHTLRSALRCVRLLTEGAWTNTETGGAAEYSARMLREFRQIDRLVSGCYSALPHFSLWCDFSMVYFAAATSTEQSDNTSAGFLLEADSGFAQTIVHAQEALGRALSCGAVPSACDRFREELRELLAPWNHVGLFQPDRPGVYERTAAR